jgi:tetrahydromethanopterin S-methyltransferase subunit C
VPPVPAPTRLRRAHGISSGHALGAGSGRLPEAAHSMDPVTLAYYGLICGLLSLAAARLRPTGLRFVAGVLVGLIAAAALRVPRQAGGF